MNPGTIDPRAPQRSTLYRSSRLHSVPLAPINLVRQQVLFCVLAFLLAGTAFAAPAVIDQVGGTALTPAAYACQASGGTCG